MTNTVWGTLRNLVATAFSWPERQRVLNELNSMDDRSLADIGITRADIPFVFRQTRLGVNDNAATPRAA